MSITAKNTGNNFELTPAGNHIARCYSMIEIGTVREEFKGEVKNLHKVRITWELPLEQRVFNPDKGEQPFSISKEYTQSSHEKAVIVKDVKSWTGEKLGPDFNPKSLIGRACNLTIAHDHKDENTYANIMGIAPLKKNEQAPAMQNKALYFDLDAFDLATFNALPEYLQTKIKGAPEYIEAVNRMNNPDAYAQPTAQAGAEKTVDLDDSIPF